MRREVIIGIDGGGGSTESIIADKNGHILGKGLSAGSNIYVSGEQYSENAIKDSIFSAGLLEDDIVISACFGLSGVMVGVDNPEAEKMVNRILPQAKCIIVVCDVINALTGAIGTGPGICINAGTGAICVGRDEKGKIIISSGWGHILGDEGSGYWIGLQGLIAALRSIDGRSQKTILTELLFDVLGFKTPQEVSKYIHKLDNPKKTIANLCPTVLKAAKEGDQVAQNIVEQAGFELALAVKSVRDRISILGEINVAPVGNCLIKSAVLRNSFIKNLVSTVKVVEPRFSPTIGSLLLAYENAGIPMKELSLESFINYSSKVR